MTVLEQLQETIPGFKSRMTEQEYETWVLRERVQAEWVDGEVILMSPVSLNHDAIVNWLHILMALFASKHKLGRVIATEVMVRLPSRRRLPDIFFVGSQRLGRFTPTYLEGAPDLAIEVVSDDSDTRDREEKFAEYQNAGVREYWIIDPISRRTDFYELDTAGKYQQIAVADGVFHSKVLVGFWIKLEWFWRHPAPEPYDLAQEAGVIAN